MSVCIFEIIESKQEPPAYENHHESYTNEQMQELQALGFSPVLSHEMFRSNTNELKIFLLDDSGSMNCGDAQKYLYTENIFKDCSRLDELKQFVRDQSKFCNIMGKNAKFLFINDLYNMKDLSDYPQFLSYIDNKRTRGSTPIKESLQYVIDNILTQDDDIINGMKKVTIILATDGYPNDKGQLDNEGGTRFLMKQIIENYDSHFVLRLCTGDNAIVEFWNEFDENEDLSLDVLDDIESEGEEIRKFNPWINYNWQLQMLRENGLNIKVFDDIDEKPLSKYEMLQYAYYVSGNLNAEEEYDDYHDELVLNSQYINVQLFRNIFNNIPLKNVALNNAALNNATNVTLINNKMIENKKAQEKPVEQNCSCVIS